jgi:hypothetical protein
MKIRPAGAELFNADRQRGRQTDMTRLLVVVAFRNFTDAPKKDNPCAIYKEGCSFLLSICVGEHERL